MTEDRSPKPIPRKIRAAAYTPVCPAHLTAMAPYAYGSRVAYFRCEANDKRPCPHRDKAPMEDFFTLENAEKKISQRKKITARR
ncbi:MAG: hypothetical protein H0T51_15130 [Pirellulales bacterium]|nr:hypothetical protein [Pirellulales bacterium]